MSIENINQAQPSAETTDIELADEQLEAVAGGYGAAVQAWANGDKGAEMVREIVRGFVPTFLSSKKLCRHEQ